MLWNRNVEGDAKPLAEDILNRVGAPVLISGIEAEDKKGDRPLRASLLNAYK